MATIDNVLLFRECRHLARYGNRVKERGTTTTVEAVSDNDFRTFSDVDDYDCDISERSDPSGVTAFYVKSKGVTSHSGTPTGGVGTGWTRTLPNTVTDYQGVSVSTTIDGFQHDLFLLPSRITATSVRIQFSGSNVQVYEMYLLDMAYEIDTTGTPSDFVQVRPNLIDRTSDIGDTGIGRASRFRGYAGDRQKTVLDWVIRVLPNVSNISDVDDFLFWLERNQRFFLANSFTDDPTAVYPVIVGGDNVSAPYRTNYKPNGYSMRMRVMER